MIGTLFQFLSRMGPTVSWAAAFVAAVIAVLVLYVGIAMGVVLLKADDAGMWYAVFRDLLGLFSRGRR